MLRGFAMLLPNLQRVNSTFNYAALRCYQAIKIYSGEYVADYDALLAQIWGGGIEIDATSDPSGLTALLTSMISAPLVVLKADAALDRPYAFMEMTEVMEGVILGDVLAEELGLEVPYGAMILIEPKGYFESQPQSGTALGQLLGLVLMDIAHPDAPLPVGLRRDEDHKLGNPIVALSEFAQNSASRIQ
jgi:hypothetical protein